MDCKRIRDLLITDYGDGEANEKVAQEVRQHLSACDSCRHFERQLQRAAVEPLRGIGEMQPPEALWHRISGAIAAERQARSFFARFAEAMRTFGIIRRPAFAVATALVVILVAVTFARLPLRSQNTTAAYLQEQAAFLSSLDTGNADGFIGADDVTFGTVLEKYFL